MKTELLKSLGLSEDQIATIIVENGKDIATYKKDSERNTRFGFGDGLGGWNCRQGFYPFFEGLSEQAYTDKQL